MKRKQRIYEDDDGRTIASMSDVSAPNLFMPKVPEAGKRAPLREKTTPRYGEDNGYSRKERFMIVMGAMKATMLIAGAFILGLGAFVLLVYLLA